MNFIARIKIDLGEWLEDAESIKVSAVDFFADLFASNGHTLEQPSTPFDLPSMLESDNDLLKRLPSIKEVNEVVFS